MTQEKNLLSSQPLTWIIFDETPIEGLAPMMDGNPPRIQKVRMRSNLFGVPVIATSDLHKDGLLIFQRLAKELNPKDYEVILAGDMAGTTRRGEDAAVGPLFDFIQAHFKGLHFVLGNHDIPPADIEQRRNPDGSPCWLDLSPRLLGGRRLCGASYIIGRKGKRGRIIEDRFEHLIAVALRDDTSESVLCTHETPLIPGFQPFIGKQEVTDMLTKKSPKVHLFGHCHLKPMLVSTPKTLFGCLDARVVLLEPS